MSPFGLRIWRECPRHYRFRYVDKLLDRYSRPKAHFTMGDHVHAVLKDFLSRVPLHQRTVEGIEVLLRQKWRRFRHGFRNAEDEKRWAQKALAQVRAFALSQDVSVHPYMVEASIEAEITPGLVLRGRVDRVDREADGGLHIIDYKTGRVPEVNDWSQLYLYALVLNRRLGLRVSRVSFLYLGSGALESSEPTRKALDRTTWELLVTATQIGRARAYGPRKGKWCSSCDFRPLCRETSPHPGGEEEGVLWTLSGGEV
ncbi:MAG: PD-(D/E)XK nuclease family protein [Dehalococcoidia bacterium]